MLKEEAVTKQIGKAILEAVNEVALELLGQYTDPTGHEENISAQIMSEFNLHLLGRISDKLNDERINGVTFSVYSYKKGKEEPFTGADLGILIDIQVDSQRVTKYILIQSKIANRYKRAGMGQVEIQAYSQNLKKQLNDMLAITTSAYVALYSPLGVHLVPASEVIQRGGKTVDTKTMYYQSLGELVKDMFRCVSGELLILGPLITNYQQLLKDFANGTNAATNLLIAAKK